VICRDRAGAYADGARTGAPDAMQVANRWHLFHNMVGHVEKIVAAHHRCLAEPPVVAEDAAPADADRGNDPIEDEPFPGAGAQRTRERYRLTGEKRAAGMAIKAIARELSLDRKTVRRFARAATAEELLVTGMRASELDDYKPYLHQRLAEGCWNARTVFAEIAEHSYPGSYQSVSLYLRPLRAEQPVSTLARAKQPPPPSVRQVASWLTRYPDSLTEEETQRRMQIPHPLARTRRDRRARHRVRADAHPARGQPAHGLDDRRRGQQSATAELLRGRAAPRSRRSHRGTHRALQIGSG
jgi:hypothetical protein